MPKQYGNLDLRNMDCMELMKAAPDNHWDLAIVDPPYGIGIARAGSIGGIRKGVNPKWKNESVRTFKKKQWDSNKPTKEYFAELIRVSKNQMIWGGNYFTDSLDETNGWVFWYKEPNSDNLKFSDGELCWTSFKCRMRQVSIPWIGFGSVNLKEAKIHICQKPVALYRWLLQNYAESKCKHCDDGYVECPTNHIQTDCDRCEGTGTHKATILDTHLGSGSIAIACYYIGFDLTGAELDPDYYAAMMDRIDLETRQQELF